VKDEMGGMEEDYDQDENEKVQRCWIWEDLVDGTKGVKIKRGKFPYARWRNLGKTSP